jgi:hypothetical protein
MPSQTQVRCCPPLEGNHPLRYVSPYPLSSSHIMSGFSFCQTCVLSLHLLHNQQVEPVVSPPALGIAISHASLLGFFILSFAAPSGAAPTSFEQSRHTVPSSDVGHLTLVFVRQAVT